MNPGPVVFAAFYSSILSICMSMRVMDVMLIVRGDLRLHAKATVKTDGLCVNHSIGNNALNLPSFA